MLLYVTHTEQKIKPVVSPSRRLQEINNAGVSRGSTLLSSSVSAG